MSHLYSNAISFLQSLYPGAVLLQQEIDLKNGSHIHVQMFLAVIVIDPLAGVKIRAIVLNEPLQDEVFQFLANNSVSLFLDLDRNSPEVQVDNTLHKTESKISSRDMPFSRRIIFYTKNSFNQRLIDSFDSRESATSFYCEDKMYHSLYVIYGDPDESIATKINAHFKNRGVKTWFFPENKSAGEKLHDMMYDGVNNNDRVLLICSKNSLHRLGVLNEIDAALTKEARTGGKSLIIPVTIDNYVFSDEWTPSKKNLKSRLLDRVITKIDSGNMNDENTIKELHKLVQLLLKKEQ
jgi:hypothetical protein